MKIKDYVYKILQILGVWCLLATAIHAQTVEPVPFERPNVMAFHLTSQFVDQVMLIEVALPFSYSFQDKSKIYPVMYFVDGLRHFPLISSNNIQLSFGDEVISPPMIPEVISVGIDFVVPFEQIEYQRLTYFTPTEAIDEDYGSIGGKADQFLDFMRYELKPFIDWKFHTDTTQELFAGHSLGGLLSLYALFTQSDIFEKFIAASPSNYWDDEVIYDFEEAYYANNPSQREYLFMSVGSREDPWGITMDYVKRLGRQINDHNYKNLAFKKKVFWGHNHGSVVVNAYARGARFVFRNLLKNSKRR
jgi:predicted alpha/beta superfamily hydrolase